MFKINNLDFTMELTPEHIMLSNAQLNVKFFNLLKNGLYNEELPFKFVVKLIGYEFCENKSNIMTTMASDFSKIYVSIQIASFMGKDQTYDLDLHEYFDCFPMNTNNSLLINDIDSDDESVKEGILVSSKTTTTRDLLLATKQELQRLKISSYIENYELKQQLQLFLANRQHDIVASVQPVPPIEAVQADEAVQAVQADGAVQADEAEPIQAVEPVQADEAVQ